MWVDKVDRIETDRQKVSKHQNAYLQSVNKQTKKSWFQNNWFLDMSKQKKWIAIQFDKETKKKVHCKTETENRKKEQKVRGYRSFLSYFIDDLALRNSLYKKYLA